MIDRLGKCPNCGMDWKGEDIKKQLDNLDVFSNKIDATVDKAAATYGWDENNPTSFTKAKILDIEDKRYVQCTNFTCTHIFNVETGDEYTTLYDLSHNIKVQRPFDIVPKEESLLNAVEKGTYTMITSEDDCPFEVDKPIIIQKMESVQREYEQTISKIQNIIDNEAGKQEDKRGDNTDRRRRESRNKFFAALRKQE